MSAVLPVSAVPLACPACGFPLAPELLAGESDTACPQCGVLLRGVVFPAFHPQGPLDAGLAEHAGEGEAVCFFHPENRAALTCERCGRFICTVCDMALGTRHLCPTCLSSGLTGEKLPELIGRRFLWAETALLLGLLPLLVFPVVFPGFIVTSPPAIFCALFGWKRPGSLPRGQRHWMAVLGLVCGGVQLAIWVSFAFLLSHSAAWRRAFR